MLAAIAEDDAHLSDLFDLDNATNERLRGERGLLPGIGIDELVSGVPNASLVNAAFTYAHPHGSRFNGPERGAWYCSFDVQTALAEVSFHKTVEYQEIGRFDDSVTYETLLADFTNEFHDIRRDARFVSCLDHGELRRLAAPRRTTHRKRSGRSHLPQHATVGRNESRLLSAGRRRERAARRGVSPHVVRRSDAGHRMSKSARRGAPCGGRANIGASTVNTPVRAP